MRRRARFLWILPLLVAATPTPGTRVGAAPRDDRPNVLVILTDDQRTGTLRAMPLTERWFAGRGMTYPNGFVTTPLCCPSRATIFTGRYAHNHGVRSNSDGSSLDQRTTVQRYLNEAGYRTGIFGKYLNGWDVFEHPPHFDRWAIFSRGLPDGYRGATWNVDGRVRTVHRYSTDYIRSRAVRFLEEAERIDGRPWFLHLSVWAPHTPTLPASRHRNAPVVRWDPNGAVMEENRSDKPPWVRERDFGGTKARRTRKGQLQTLMSVDELVHRVLVRVRRLGEARDTLVFFLSDNGFLWGEHGLKGKTSPYTWAIRVPFFARWPGRLEPGGIDDRLVTNVDVAPTILDAAGIEPSHELDGRSLLRRSWARERLLTEFWRLPGHFMPTWASLRTSEVQYVEYYDQNGAMVFREFYDLRTDRLQNRNLLGDSKPGNDPSILALASLSARLAQDRRCRGSEGATACP